MTDAVRAKSLKVHYQGQYDVPTGRSCGVEALARWTLTGGNAISPGKFVPAAEQLGLIQDLGRHILNSACITARPWCCGEYPLTVAVNVSVLQIDAKFCAVIERILDKTQLPARNLELEITESALIGHPERTIGYLNGWKKLGVRIAVDDFGTGYSSLNYLARLPLDRLKIDRSLVQRVPQDAKSVAILRLILALANELGLDVIAEGVETEQQFHLLSELGCPAVQGFLLGQPLPADQARIALGKPWGNRIPPDVDHTTENRGDAHAA